MAFIGHGSPMNALEHNRFTDAWREVGRAVPRPEAILVVSAHWFTSHTAVTAMERPRTIHDFYGFPDELFEVDYPAPGAPDVAGEVVEAVKPRWAGLDVDQWGIDHGTWSVLVHMFPDADVPVLQLAIDASKSYEEHLALGASLDALRDRRVLIVGSGNVVHNLRRVDWSQPDAGYDWARRFDDDARRLLTSDPAGVVGLASHPDHDLAVPTPDHFLPLLYVAGAAAAAGETASTLVEGYALGALSMTCYGVGCDLPGLDDAGPPAAPLPTGLSPEDTNA